MVKAYNLCTLRTARKSLTLTRIVSREGKEEDPVLRTVAKFSTAHDLAGLPFIMCLGL